MLENEPSAVLRAMLCGPSLNKDDVFDSCKILEPLGPDNVLRSLFNNPTFIFSIHFKVIESVVMTTTSAE